MAAARDSTLYSDSLDLLRRLGVDNPRVGVPGAIPITNRLSKPRITSYEQVETTSDLQKRANDLRGLIQVAIDTKESAKSLVPCLGFLPCLIRPGCCKTDTTWIDPQIAFDQFPERIPNATVHLNPWNAYIEGQIQAQFKNKSTEGKRVDTKTCKCIGGNPGTIQSIVSGSADIDSNGHHSMLADDINAVIAKVEAAFQRINPGNHISNKFSFNNPGALETLKNLLQLLFTGTINTGNHITTTITYNWLGNQKSRSFDLHVSAVLPVDNVNYAW